MRCMGILEPVLRTYFKKKVPVPSTVYRNQRVQVPGFEFKSRMMCWSAFVVLFGQSVPWVAELHIPDHIGIFHLSQLLKIRYIGYLFPLTPRSWVGANHSAATCFTTFKFLCLRMSDLIAPYEGTDIESSSTTTNNKTKDAIDWEVNEDKRAAREKSLWFVRSYLHQAYSSIDIIW